MPKLNGSFNAPDRNPNPSPAGATVQTQPQSGPPHRLPIVLLAGATGVGKTALSLRLAHRFRAEIINADSMQVYRYLDIGTAKPSKRERATIPHHLWDLVDPDRNFDAARYAGLARSTVDALHTLGRLPLVVGGTGLYMKALEKGLCPGPPSDPALREQLRKDADENGMDRLHRELRQCDPDLAEKLHPNDRQRVLRALEVFRLTATPLSRWQAQHGFGRARYPAIKIFLARDREELYRRIDDRVREMIARGFVEEVRNLLERGFGPQLKSMQSLGYRHLIRHLQGEQSLPEAIREIQRDTRHYAKRQLTWFRGDPEFNWFHADQDKAVEQYLRSQLTANGWMQESTGPVRPS